MSASNPELERLLVENPNDRASALVYGDWLAEAGDARGELVQVQLALERAGGRRGNGKPPRPDTAAAELTERERALLLAHAVEWAGPIATCAAVELVWRRGFVDAVLIDHDQLSAEIDKAALLTELLTRPAGRLVRSLSSRGFDRCNFDDLPPVLAATRPPLRELIVDLQWSGHIDMHGYAPELGDFGPLWRALPRLEKLTLVGSSHTLELGDIDAPQLRHFEAHTPYGLESGCIESITRARWPALETLEVRRCDDRDDELLRRLCDAVDLPRLQHLGLPEGSFSDAICDRVARSKLLPQLTTLELGVWDLTVTGARALVEQDRAFAHLSRLRVHYNTIEIEAEALLRGTRFARLG